MWMMITANLKFKNQEILIRRFYLTCGASIISKTVGTKVKVSCYDKKRVPLAARPATRFLILSCPRSRNPSINFGRRFEKKI